MWWLGLGCCPSAHELALKSTSVDWQGNYTAAWHDPPHHHLQAWTWKWILKSEGANDGGRHRAELWRKRDAQIRRREAQRSHLSIFTLPGSFSRRTWLCFFTGCSSNKRWLPQIKPYASVEFCIVKFSLSDFGCNQKVEEHRPEKTWKQKKYLHISSSSY